VASAVAVAGGKVTGRLTLAVVVFAVLVVAGVLLTYLVDRRADSGEQGNRADDAAGAHAEARAVDVRGARGLQIGDSNVQLNLFARDDDDNADV